MLTFDTEENVEEQKRELFAEKVFDEVIKTKKPLIISNLDTSNPFKKFPIHKKTSSVLIVPIISWEKELGIIVLENIKSNAYTKLDSSLVMNFVEQVSLTIENVQLFHRVKMLSIVDELTGLYNRRYMYEQGKQEFMRSQNNNLPLSLVIIDIDDFKKVNDTYGHLIGDDVLKVIAKQCLQVVRKKDMACRYGGEEFLLVLPEADIRNAKNVSERLRKAIGSVSMPIKNKKTLAITASFGVASLSKDIDSFEQLVKNADTALYLAKSAGKNTVKLA